MNGEPETRRSDLICFQVYPLYERGATVAGARRRADYQHPPADGRGQEVQTKLLG